MDDKQAELSAHRGGPTDEGRFGHSGLRPNHPTFEIGASVPKHSGNLDKQTIYFLSSIIAEIRKEAIRQDRSTSWVVQRAWKLARAEIKNAPTRARVAPVHDAVSRPEREVGEVKPRAA